MQGVAKTGERAEVQWSSVVNEDKKVEIAGTDGAGEQGDTIRPLAGSSTTEQDGSM